MILVSEIKLELNQDEKELEKILLKKLRINKNELISFKVYKRSIDARKDAVYKYQLLVNCKNEDRLLKIKNVAKFNKIDTNVKHINSDIRPVIVGYGPSGIFSTYRLVEAGLKPIVIEKGKRIDERVKDVETFFKTGQLNINSNVQFGEGGAGTFSDAKLTTRIKDPFVEYILDVFVRFGAREDIKYTPHAHIGTDCIREIIKKITDYLIDKGTTFFFEEELKELILNDNHEVIGIQTNKQEIYSPICVLAIGHSSYNTIKKLNKQNVHIVPKDISIGFRVEHPQSLIDNNQKGDGKHACEYFLRYKDEKGVYSFCMCPGGIVIPATSDLNSIVTNGMSYAARNSGIANSAILIQVNKEEYPSGNLGGFEYLKHFEQKAYEYSNSYKALSSNIRDFINNTSNNLIFESTYPLGTTLCDYNDFFNKKDVEILKRALIYFDSKIPGFISEGIMVGPETRSSCPVRIERNASLESINTKGLFPSGEGAGYGGGIMSCALDGIRVANKILENLTNYSL